MASLNSLSHAMASLGVDATTSQIPSRVMCKVPLKVATSSIAGAGRGIFVAESGVKAGELIFKISEPLLTIIGGHKMLRNTCDNCLATTANKRVELCDPNIQFLRCKCTVLHYCSKKCQDVAWNHHHQYECLTLAKVRFAAFLRDSPFDPLCSKTCRCLFRLLFLHANGKISTAEWAEFKSLPTKMEAKMQLPGFAKAIGDASRLTDVLQPVIDSSALSREEVMELIFASWNNELEIKASAIRRLDAAGGLGSVPFETLGICLEPFVSLINHSCRPNAWLVFEGKEIRIRARQDVSAGEEITVSYVDPSRSFEEQRAIIKQKWAFDCTCTLCVEGNPDPTGVLGARVSKLIENGKIDSVLDLQNLEQTIRDMRAAGYTLANQKMHQLEAVSLIGSFAHRNAGKVLKSVLALCFVTGAQGIRLEDRLNHSFNLLYFIENSGYQKDEQLEAPIKELLSKVFLHLRAKFVKDTENFFGADSALAKFERKEFERALQKKKKAHPDAKLYVSLASRHKSERRQFVSNMNKLLVWAKLPALTKEELI